jgi:soluble lytic murein transglycosylase
MLLAAPSERTRWAWECAYPTPYAEYVRNTEALEVLPSGLVYAVMRQESSYDPDAVSPARAVGLLQLMPETAAAVASAMGIVHDEGSLASPPRNIALGAHFLKELVTKFKGQLPFAVAGYNAGPEAVVRWAGRSQDTAIDVFVERIAYAETRNYVVRVMGNYARYAFLEKGEDGVPQLKLAP